MVHKQNHWQISLDNTIYLQSLVFVNAGSNTTLHASG